MDYDILEKLPRWKQFEILENVKKNLTFSENCAIINELRPYLEEEASSRRKAGAKLALGKQKFKVRDFLAACLNMSHGQIDKILCIMEAVEKNPKKFGDIPTKIDRGMSVECAHQLVTKHEKFAEPTPDLPEKEFEVIYVDFPWEYTLKTKISPKYKTMSVEEGKKIKIPSYKNCVMYFWITMSNIEQAQEIINHHGFKIISEIIWVKMKEPSEPIKTLEDLNKYLQKNYGHYANGMHEKLYVCIKGKPGTPLYRPPSIIFAERTKHSSKPRIFARMIEKAYPNRKRLEMFARSKDPEDDGNWIYWGDEVEKSDPS